MSQVADIFPQVRNIIADVLVIDESEVELNKRLIADLGAESIDFLDLVFQIEREFKIKVPRGQLEKDARGALSETEFEQNGVITAKGLEVLKASFNEVPAEYFKDNLKVSEIPTLFTVETFCKLILRAMSEQNANAEQVA